MSLGIWWPQQCYNDRYRNNYSDIFLPEHRVEHGSTIQLPLWLNGTAGFFPRLSKLSPAEQPIDMFGTNRKRYQPLNSRALNSWVHQPVDLVSVRSKAERTKAELEGEFE